jgi:anti-anti-sigma factor
MFASADRRPLTIEAAQGRTASRLILAGDLDMATAPLLDRAVDVLVRQGKTKLEIDFAEVRFIDSKGLAILVSASRKLGSDGPSLVLSGLTPSLMRIFEVTGLLRFFDFVS